MTPRQYIEEREKCIKEWHIPLFSKKQWTLQEGLESMNAFKLGESEVPLIIRLVENPKYDVGLFAGNVSLFNHDSIHLLLGRGLEVKDEAFVIGFTMGSTKKMRRWRRNLYMFCAKYLFPEGYKFKEEERFIFNLGVKAGSACTVDLSEVNFNKYPKDTLTDVRDKLHLNVPLLRSCYEIEKEIFRSSPESQRLL